MKKIILVAGGLSVMFLTGQAQAQHLVRDYVLDKHKVYQPDDPVHRGFLYQLQTGHAGLFKHCDDDLAKMHAPYISWHCRPGGLPRPVSNFARDFDRKLTRLRDGAGTCSIHANEQRNADVSACEMINQKTEAAPERLTQIEVLPLDRQLAEQMRSPLKSTAPLNEPTSERCEQLRIQRMHR